MNGFDSLWREVTLLTLSWLEHENFETLWQMELESETLVISHSSI